MILPQTIKNKYNIYINMAKTLKNTLKNTTRKIQKNKKIPFRNQNQTKVNKLKGKRTTNKAITWVELVTSINKEDKVNCMKNGVKPPTLMDSMIKAKKQWKILKNGGKGVQKNGGKGILKNGGSVLPIPLALIMKQIDNISPESREKFITTIQDKINGNISEEDKQFINENFPNKMNEIPNVLKEVYNKLLNSKEVENNEQEKLTDNVEQPQEKLDNVENNLEEEKINNVETNPQEEKVDNDLEVNKM